MEIDCLHEKNVKILRDLAHGYINLTEFEIEIIDTPHFQRLKEIRQTTCFHVYPDARHTRFEHSLGVMQLVRRALAAIKENGIISPSGIAKIDGIDTDLIFNSRIAALLHDIGHCPLSHLGEKQFFITDVQKKLSSALTEFNKTATAEMKISNEAIEKFISHKVIHEMLSCYIILKKYREKLSSKNVDFELVLRSITGYTYSSDKKNKNKNIVISLINSSNLDMDKLDYIIRDSFYIGISVPPIDTKRLFRNLYSNERGELVFSSKAIPVLQTIIETRDNLYLWAYNHHTAVYSDFLYYYVLRKLVRADYPEKCKKGLTYIGKLNREDFFCVDAVAENLVSDADFLSTLRKQYLDCTKIILKNIHTHPNFKAIKEVAETTKQIFERKFLKPLWKSIFEFNSFIKSNFQDISDKETLAAKICGVNRIFDDDERLNEKCSEEFRAQIAKAVRRSLAKYMRTQNLENILEISSFFIIPRSNKFYRLDAISKIHVYFKKPEALYGGEQYYSEKLTNIIPQRTYDSFYQENHYYIYLPDVKTLEYKLSNQNLQIKAEDVMKKIVTFFVAAAKSLNQMPIEDFKAKYKKEIQEK